MDLAGVAMLFWAGITALYLILTVRQARWCWRYLVLAVWGAMTVGGGVFAGRFLGYFCPELPVVTRAYFYQELVNCINGSTDFAGALQLMEHKIAAGEFVHHLNQAAVDPWLPWWLVAGILLFFFTVAAEFIRRSKLKIVLILVFSVMAVGCLSMYAGGKKHHFLARNLAMRNYREEVAMLHGFAGRSAPALSQPEIAAAVTGYYLAIRGMHHREPILVLAQKLWPETE